MRFKALGCCVVLLLLAGCATQSVDLKHPGAFEKDQHAQHSWHHLRFKWTWPEGRRPDWSLDPLVADLVLSDLISRRLDSLPLWRFHRRAARDGAGHQFSFIFYATPATARELRESVAAHRVIRRLREQGVLEKVYLTTPARASKLYATSDASWPSSIQSTWPMFIMGVSQTWLGLVEIHAGNTAGLDEDLDRAFQRYRTVNDKVDKLWFEHAQHAFFHHISGVFGYQPVRIHKRMQF